MSDNKIIQIDSSQKNSFQVTWDMGRRCNFDCTYCPDHRHNNSSSHASLETLIKTSKFVFDYKKLIDQYSVTPKEWMIGFTGGEPTNNPNLLDMCQYINEQNDPMLSVDVTSNGSFSEKYCERMYKLINKMTISYHCEANPKIKSRVLDRIYQVKDLKQKTSNGKFAKINLMIHADPNYWEECMGLVKRFQRDGIKFVPRIIGENYENSRYTHRYTPEQHQWFKDYWKEQNEIAQREREEEEIEKRRKTAEYEYKTETGAKTKSKSENMIETMRKMNNGTKQVKVNHSCKINKSIKKQDQTVNTRKELGRPCCGGGTMCTSNQSGKVSYAKQLPNTEFRDWGCLINWHWLHIEQEYDKILHHQTCRSTFGGKVGEIGTISDCEKIIDRLKKQFATGTMPVIKCPKKLCGCGLCISKAKNNEDITKLFYKTVKNLTPVLEGNLVDL
ncbi:MAG: hypothetical protein CBC05_01630 [Crocinitomicaceae bacterium TMED45]|nr:MAG: hypothetical protein CBC05_01630 [Crocinitomicaceae bacterium TMED45]|tara:strand:- start:16056 stop:17390 length:1335 start_codon:yes stop_codon:yes gene_type:complete